MSWDFGRKVFACEKSPHILAYIGDVLFASVTLSQIASSIDAGALFAEAAPPDEQFRAVVGAVEASFNAVPVVQQRAFTVLFGLREGEGMAFEFHLFSLGWSSNHGWHQDRVPIPNRSAALRILGSGGAVVSEWHGKWEESSQGGTSRAIFSAFCDAIASGTDPLTGGAPQLVHLYRKWPAAVTGVVFGGRPYLLGLPLQTNDIAESIQWRNELFERCDLSGKVLTGAQKHGAPRGLGPQSRKSAG
jgi:hypothetical protein